MGREGRPSLGPGTDFGRSLAGHWDQGRPSPGPGMDGTGRDGGDGTGRTGRDGTGLALNITIIDSF